MNGDDNQNKENSFSFFDLFDLEQIQTLQDAASKALGVGMVMTGPDGTPYTQNSQFCDFCMKVVRGSEKGNQLCRYSDSVLGRPNKNGPTLSRCLSAGLMDAGASIVVGNVHVANWLLGQVRIEGELLTDEEKRERALALDIDPELFQLEMDKTPLMTRERFQLIADMVFVLAKQLSELGLKNYLQREEIRFREELEAHLIFSNEHDPLTRLYNRLFFDRKLFELDKKGVYPVSIVMGDVNHLKLSNDIFGHEEGDRLLLEISTVMKEEAEETYFVCRCGGDELNVILPDANQATAEAYIARVRQRLELEYETILPPMIAFGVREGGKNEPLRRAMKRAEDSMYTEKHLQKERFDLIRTIRERICATGYLSETELVRIRQMTLQFAAYLKLDEIELMHIRDLLEYWYLGLIVVPKEVLASRSSYADDIWEEQYGITEVEYRLARIYDRKNQFAKYILMRYERFDGTGKPDGLAGEEIPFCVRFFAVLHCYSILSCAKPHGYGYDNISAYVRMRQELGKSIDPALAEQFFEFLLIYE